MQIYGDYPTINADHYHNEDHDDVVIGNATVECARCNASNRPFRKKIQPICLSMEMERCNDGPWGFDLCSRWETTCSSCRKKFLFRILYQQ